MDTLTKVEQALGRPALLRQVALGEGDDLVIGRWRHRDADLAYPQTDDLVTVIYNISNTQRVSNGVRTAKLFDAGTVTVIGPNDPASFSVRGRADVLQIFLPAQAISRLTACPAIRSVKPRFQEHDRSIGRCALQAMVAAGSVEPGSDLKLAEVASELSSCLIAWEEPPFAMSVGGLAPFRLRRVEEFISQRLMEQGTPPPTLDEMAGEAELSLFHFARAFRESVGQTPSPYVLERRLALARRMLAHWTIPIAEVARRAGFKSQAHFSDRFRRSLGVSPSEYRRAVQA